MRCWQRAAPRRTGPRARAPADRGTAPAHAAPTRRGSPPARRRRARRTRPAPTPAQHGETARARRPTRSANCAPSVLVSFIPTMLGCAASRADGVGREVDAGERGVVVEEHRHRDWRPRRPCSARSSAGRRSRARDRRTASAPAPRRRPPPPRAAPPRWSRASTRGRPRRSARDRPALPAAPPRRRGPPRRRRAAPPRRWCRARRPRRGRRRSTCRTLRSNGRRVDLAVLERRRHRRKDRAKIHADERLPQERRSWRREAERSKNGRGLVSRARSQGDR